MSLKLRRRRSMYKYEPCRRPPEYDSPLQFCMHPSEWWTMWNKDGDTGPHCDCHYTKGLARKINDVKSYYGETIIEFHPDPYSPNGVWRPVALKLSPLEDV